MILEGQGERGERGEKEEEEGRGGNGALGGNHPSACVTAMTGA